MPHSPRKAPWPEGERELAQVRDFNKKLGWMPRFKIRNRVVPRMIQMLLRASQLVGADKLRKHGLKAERKRIDSGGVPVAVRIIRPKGRTEGVVLDFHGGGWVIGNAQMNDNFNIAIVNTCNVTVVSVDYRLAVSTPIEGVMDDCVAAARWLLSENEFAGLPVIVVGESAGAHLAAATLLALKNSPGLLQRVNGALLYYGVYDMSGTPSVREAPPETLLLDGPGMVEALRKLTPELNDEQRRQPPLSPLYGDFSGFPPALMFAGELDPLRDDTLDIAERWMKSAPVEVYLLPSSPHGFIHFPTAIAESVLAYSREWISARVEAQASITRSNP
ncbi:alpha/beta hydrolase fold domain-containing protein [Pseudomonas sp. TH06]|uniref:alpha/beta hydrolase fold domain-containing protein n=1 Tax=Pseudomonas sp. TH06 TaxID=2796372 RepID=UPI001914B00E|nr:alpha/beta hydrolase fold domain-containing protein [Pseudomonas sp. TH06]MBK5529209.1 alpha/beta hydrolase fold domain-containing protein [Pseudomonas sp. TH06]